MAARSGQIRSQLQRWGCVVTIDHDQILDGDEVRLRDSRSNVLVANAKHDGDERQNLYVIAFGTRIYFARRTAAGWQRVSGIDVVAHQQSFDFDQA